MGVGTTPLFAPNSIVGSDRLFALSRAGNGAAHGFWHADSAAGCGRVSVSAGLVLNVAAIPAAGAMVNGGANSIYAGGTVTHTAQHATLDRWDIIYIDSSGAPAITAGTAATSPAPPALTSARLALAQVKIKSTSNGGGTIAAGDIIDLRQQLCGPRYLFKTADETVSSSIVLQNDDHLFFSVEPSEQWYVRLNLNCTMPTAQGFNFAYALPSGGLHYNYVIARVSGGTGVYFNQGSPSVGAAVTIATPGFIIGAMTIDTFIINSTTAGTAQFQWCQNVSGAFNTTINGDVADGSFGVAYRVA